jgi:TonB family protein
LNPVKLEWKAASARGTGRAAEREIRWADRNHVREPILSLVFLLLVQACNSPSERVGAAPEPRASTETSAAKRAPIARESEPVRVVGDVIAPVAIHRVDPSLDECKTQRVRLSGVPLVETVIDESGVPTNVRMAKAVHPCIDRAAVEAVKLWRFKPAMHRGKPVAVTYHLTVHVNVR